MNSEEPELEPGTVPGYRLREKIGEGGMGEVFLAEQVKPVPRAVALKRLKHAADGGGWLARFGHELEALALLDHPDVATVFDAGVADDGRPFYTMELVEGLPLTLFCDRARLSLPDRLRLMARVCAAVDYAHRRGVWHGDLKPSNLLAAPALEGGEPELKLIDFGVRRASLAGGECGARGAAMFTPGYASPESRAGSGWDSRSDVFSLGVVLGELLAGQPPGAGGTLSAWFRASSDAGKIAAARRTTPRALVKLLRDDLDWIAARATAADPAARYGSAADLAADLQRVLQGHPVQAHPVSLRYELGKFLRRERRRLVLAGAAALVILGTLAGVLRHQASARHARENLERSRAEVRRAMHQTALLQDLVRGIAMLARAPDDSMRDAGLTEVLDRAAREAERAGAAGDRAAAVSLLAASAEAAAVLERHELAIAQWKGALRWLEAGHPQRMAIEGALARSLLAAGDYDEAVTLLGALAAPERLGVFPPPQQLDVLTDLARAHFAARDFSAAAPWAEKAVAAGESALGREEPPVLLAVLLLGKCYTELQRYPEARTALARAAEGLPSGTPPATEAQQWLAEVEQVLAAQEEP